MASHAVRKPSRIRAARRWVRLRIAAARRHVPFTVYAVATAALMVWTICTMACIPR